MKCVRVATLFGAVVITLSLTSCVSSPEPAPTDRSEFGQLGLPDCAPPSPVLGQEVQGTTPGSVTAFGEFQGVDAAKLTEATPIKLVVRMTGSGELAVDMTAPDGTTHLIDWGPERHAASNYDRPGDEWGIGFTFDAPGCWALNLQRDGADRATFWLEVEGGS